MLEHDPLAGWRFPRAADEHVVPAIGRDYTDVAPMDGVDRGLGRTADRRVRQRHPGRLSL